VRLLVTERVFGIKSREAVAALSLDKLERGLKILQAFEKRVRADKSMLDKGELEVLAQLGHRHQALRRGKGKGGGAAVLTGGLNPWGKSDRRQLP